MQSRQARQSHRAIWPMIRTMRRVGEMSLRLDDRPLSKTSPTPYCSYCHPRQVTLPVKRSSSMGVGARSVRCHRLISLNIRTEKRLKSKPMVPSFESILGTDADIAKTRLIGAAHAGQLPINAKQ